MATDTGTYRPIKEVDTSTAELRGVWWNPTLKSKLPSWKVWAVVAFFAVAALGAQPLLGILIIAAAIAYVVMKNRANSQPIEATSLQVLRNEISSAIEKTTNQLGPDLGIESLEFNDARASKLLLVLSEGAGPIRVQPAPGVFEQVKTSVFIITPKGLGYLINEYDTVNQRFRRHDSELLFWKRVARVRVSGEKLIIEATSGSKVEVPLDPESKVESPGFGVSITELVNPFVREAQKRLEASST